MGQIQYDGFRACASIHFSPFKLSSKYDYTTTCFNHKTGSDLLVTKLIPFQGDKAQIFHNKNIESVADKSSNR